MAESYRHADFKSDIYWSFAEDDNYAEVEKTIGRTRTDVLAGIGDRLVAIEVQHTRIPIKSIRRRMAYHTEIGAHTLWIITPETLMHSRGVRSLNWVLFIQQIQGGVIFLPGVERQTVVPAHIDNTLIFYKNDIIAGHKWLDQKPEVEIDKLCFEKNMGLNITSYPDWWSEGYLTFIDDFL